MDEKQFLKAEKGENLWNHVVDGINNIDKEVSNYVLTCFKEANNVRSSDVVISNTDIDIGKFNKLISSLTRGKKSEYKKKIRKIFNIKSSKEVGQESDKDSKKESKKESKKGKKLKIIPKSKQKGVDKYKHNFETVISNLIALIFSFYEQGYFFSKTVNDMVKLIDKTIRYPDYILLQFYTLMTVLKLFYTDSEKEEYREGYVQASLSICEITGKYSCNPDLVNYCLLDINASFIDNISDYYYLLGKSTFYNSCFTSKSKKLTEVQSLVLDIIKKKDKKDIDENGIGTYLINSVTGTGKTIMFIGLIGYIQKINSSDDLLCYNKLIQHRRIFVYVAPNKQVGLMVASVCYFLEIGISLLRVRKSGITEVDFSDICRPSKRKFRGYEPIVYICYPENLESAFDRAYMAYDHLTDLDKNPDDIFWFIDDPSSCLDFPSMEKVFNLLSNNVFMVSATLHINHPIIKKLPSKNLENLLIITPQNDYGISVRCIERSDSNESTHYMPFSKCETLADLETKIRAIKVDNNMKRLVHPVYYKELRSRILEYKKAKTDIDTSFLDHYNNWVLTNKRKVTYTDFIKIVLNTVDKIRDISRKLLKDRNIETANHFVKHCLFSGIKVDQYQVYGSLKEDIIKCPPLFCQDGPGAIIVRDVPNCYDFTGLDHDLDYLLKINRDYRPVSDIYKENIRKYEVTKRNKKEVKISKNTDQDEIEDLKREQSETVLMSDLRESDRNIINSQKYIDGINQGLERKLTKTTPIIQGPEVSELMTEKKLMVRDIFTDALAAGIGVIFDSMDTLYSNCLQKSLGSKNLEIPYIYGLSSLAFGVSFTTSYVLIEDETCDDITKKGYDLNEVLVQLAGRCGRQGLTETGIFIGGPRVIDSLLQI